MTLNAGVWIDHHKAVVILLSDERQDVVHVYPDPDGSKRAPSLSRPQSPAPVVSDPKRERRKMIHLNKYYDEVITCLHDADAILILGPGEAKGEFTKRFEGKDLKGHVAHVGTVDKMTDPEIAAHVRRLFSKGFEIKDART